MVIDIVLPAMLGLVLIREASIESWILINSAGDGKLEEIV